MKRTATIGIVNIALIGAFALAGCGGGGNGTSSTGGTLTTGTGRAAILVTDGPREDYAQDWATIYHVELVPQSGTPVVVFDDANGKRIDLKTLRDASGARYSFLGSATVPQGTYTGVNVTIGATMQLFQGAAMTGNPLPVDSSIAKDSMGHPVINIAFRSPRTLGTGNDNIVVDFNLARFIVKDSKVLPALAEGDGAGLNDPARHEKDEYRGTVSNLTGTAPAYSFTLDRGNNMTATVTTTASTALYGDLSNALANGACVEVTGTLDTTTQAIVATRLEVCPPNQPGHETDRHSPNVAGAASSLNATARTFIVTVKRADGFTPTQTTVTVVTNTATVFRGDPGKQQTPADFFAALTTTPNVIVEGTYDATTNILTATSAKVMDAAKDGGWARDAHNFRGDRQDWGNGATPPPPGDGNGNGHN